MFESSSEDVIAYLGPAISSEVFEVGYEGSKGISVIMQRI